LSAEPSPGPQGIARTDPVEVEVKLAVSRPRRIARLIRDFDRERLGEFRAAGDAHMVVHTDRYFDTAVPGGRLLERAMRARLRRHGRTVTLAVKHSGAEAAGITTRAELEGRATDTLDPHRWPATDARTALLAAVGEQPLVEIARLRQRRLTRLVRGHGATIELSLDRVDAMVEGQVAARRHELEAELKSGDAAALGRLLEALSGIDGLAPSAGSKLAFALAARATAGTSER
jgi:inorganic triphosphatase YgiF